MTDQNAALQSYAGSYAGKRRQNEDSFGFQEPEDSRTRATRGCLYVVCDGMGGHASGEVASSMAVETILKAYFDAANPPLDSLCAAIQQANARVYAASQASDRDAEMGCTVVAFLVAGDRAWVAHVGDSRAYRMRGEHLERLTRDHRYVTEVLGLDEEAANHHHMKSRLSRAIGLQPEIKIDTAAIDLAAGDRFLLCSDGLTSVLTDDRIRPLLGLADPEKSVTRLLEAAKELGVDDNTTALAVRIDRLPAASAVADRDVVAKKPAKLVFDPYANSADSASRYRL